MNSHRLRGHLLRGHGRTGPELDGLPLEVLHRFEHLEHAMGLITLSHEHAPDATPPRLDHAPRRMGARITDQETQGASTVRGARQQ